MTVPVPPSTTTDRTFLSTRTVSNVSGKGEEETTWLKTIQQAFPTAKRYRRLVSINQANAQGCILEVDLLEDDESSSSTTIIFLKHVQASDYIGSKKDWTDLRRTLLYARTEIRFYKEFVPLLSLEYPLTPKLHYAHYNFEPWIQEEETAASTPSTMIEKDHLTNPENKYGVLIMECVDVGDASHQYFQDSPLSIEQSKKCLKAVAHLHASTWENTQLLKLASSRLSKASFHLSVRNPKELASAKQTWNDFIVAFEDHLLKAKLLPSDSIRTLGSRVAKLATFISEQVSPQPSDPFATIIHGDYKSMNVFLPRHSCSADNIEKDSTCSEQQQQQHAIMVDFASTGIGYGMSDLAMHTHHAILPKRLSDRKEEELVKCYWEYLTSLLPNDVATQYTWDIALRQYKYALVDYFRFFMARMWKGATPETFAKKADNKNVNLVNRSIPAAMQFIKVVNEYMIEIEQEYYSSSNN